MLQLQDKVGLWANEPLKALSDHSVLVMNGATGMLLVQKAVSAETAEVYKKAVSLRAPGVCRVFDVDLCDGQLTAVCEYINGMSLDKYCKYHRLCVDSVYAIVLQLCDALAALHAEGIVHRDVKPENIIVSDRGERICLIDFGISRTVKSGQPSDTSVLGTVGYAAPEQFGFGQTDARTDIYAVGVLLNVLLSGKMPCETMYGGLFHNVILRCTQQDPAMRYQSVQALKDDLVRTYVSAKNGAVPADDPSPSPVQKETPFSRLLHGIPGFRAKKPAFMLLAVLFYPLAVLLICCFFAIMDEPSGYVYSILISLLLIVFPFLIVTDAWGILSRQKVFAGLSKFNFRLVQVFGVLVCFLLLCAVFLVMPENLLTAPA